KMSDMTAVGPACISRAIERAATSRWPKARYVAPLRAGVMVGFLRLLPTAWADFVMRLVSGLTARGLGTDAPLAPARALAAPGRRAAARALRALAVVLGGLAPSNVSADDGGWERLRTKDGIVVSRKEIAGRPFVAFRGEGDVDAPIRAVADVLVDVPHEK